MPATEPMSADGAPGGADVDGVVNSQSLDGGPSDQGQLGFLTFTPSEFSLVSAQVRRRDTIGSDEMTYFLKTTFNIGPHGQHPF